MTLLNLVKKYWPWPTRAPARPPANVAALAPPLTPQPVTVVRIFNDKWPQIAGRVCRNLPCPVNCAACGQKHFLPIHIREHFFLEHRPAGGKVVFLCAGCRPDFVPHAQAEVDHE